MYKIEVLILTIWHTFHKYLDTWVALINCPNDNLIPYSNCSAIQPLLCDIKCGRELASNWIRSTSSLASFRSLLISHLALLPALSPVSGHYAKSNSFTGPYGNILGVGVASHPFIRTRILVGITSWSKCGRRIVDCIDDPFADAAARRCANRICREWSRKLFL